MEKNFLQKLPIWGKNERTVYGSNTRVYNDASEFEVLKKRPYGVPSIMAVREVSRGGMYPSANIQISLCLPGQRPKKIYSLEIFHHDGETIIKEKGENPMANKFAWGK